MSTKRLPEPPENPHIQPVLREVKIKRHPYDYRYHGVTGNARNATDYELARTMFQRRQALAFAVHEAAGDNDLSAGPGVMNVPAYEDALRKLEIFDALFNPPTVPPSGDLPAV